MSFSPLFSGASHSTLMPVLYGRGGVHVSVPSSLGHRIQHSCWLVVNRSIDVSVPSSLGHRIQLVKSDPPRAPPPAFQSPPHWDIVFNLLAWKTTYRWRSCFMPLFHG